MLSDSRTLYFTRAEPNCELLGLPVETNAKLTNCNSTDPNKVCQVNLKSGSFGQLVPKDSFKIM